MKLNISASIEVDSPENPDAEQVALDIVADEMHELAGRVRRRLEERGVRIDTVSVDRPPAGDAE